MSAPSRAMRPLTEVDPAKVTSRKVPPDKVAEPVTETLSRVPPLRVRALKAESLTTEFPPMLAVPVTLALLK